MYYRWYPHNVRYSNPIHSNNVVLDLKRELSYILDINAGFFIIYINDDPAEAATGGVL